MLVFCLFNATLLNRSNYAFYRLTRCGSNKEWLILVVCNAFVVCLEIGLDGLKVFLLGRQLLLGLAFQTFKVDTVTRLYLAGISGGEQLNLAAVRSSGAQNHTLRLDTTHAGRLQVGQAEYPAVLKGIISFYVLKEKPITAPYLHFFQRIPLYKTRDDSAVDTLTVAEIDFFNVQRVGTFVLAA